VRKIPFTYLVKERFPLAGKRETGQADERVPPPNAKPRMTGQDVGFAAGRKKKVFGLRIQESFERGASGRVRWRKLKGSGELGRRNLNANGRRLVEVPLKEFGTEEVFLVWIATASFFGVGDGFVEIVPGDGAGGWEKGEIKGDAELREKEARAFVLDGRVLVREAKGMPGTYGPEWGPAKEHRKPLAGEGVFQHPARGVVREEDPLLHGETTYPVSPLPGVNPLKALQIAITRPG